MRGGRTHDEYLSRSNSPYAYHLGNPMYKFHQGLRDPFNTDYVIYAPDVVVFRNDDGERIDTPYRCSIITCPAVYAPGVRKDFPERLDEIEPVMWNRILKVLSVAAHHGHETLVLGSWGCGVFENDPTQIAQLFRRALKENFQGAFQSVRFSVTDWSKERRSIGPFERELGAAFGANGEV